MHGGATRMAAVLLLALAGAAVAQNTQLRVTTFNAGLLSALGQGVQYTTEREPAVMSAMATEAANTDVLCVQEFWGSELMTDLADQVRSELTYAVGATNPLDPDTEAFTPCGMFTFTAFVACAQLECEAEIEAASNSGSFDDGLAALKCMVDECPVTMKVVSSDASCYACLMTVAVEGGDISECGTDFYSDRGWNNQFGMALFTRFPIHDHRFIRIPSMFGVRGAAYAEISHPEMGIVGVTCTHLSPNTDLTYFGYHDSWEAEQDAQITKMNELFSEGPANQLLVGDLNTGPALSGTDSAGTAFTTNGEFSSNYARLVAGTGLESRMTGIYADTAGDRVGNPCTFCADNPVTDTTNNKILDHVMAFGPLADNVTSVTKLFTANTVSVAGVAGDVAISDHYGVRVEFDWWPTEDSASTASLSVVALAALALAAIRAADA